MLDAYNPNLNNLIRISIEDEGCEKLLSHKSCQSMLQKLVNSLGCDNAGKFHIILF
jgi:hypothetical protein